MSTWKSCRKQEKAIRGMMIHAQRKAEKRASQVPKQDPLEGLRVHGTSAKYSQDSEQHYLIENGVTLMAWQGRSENMIDRFDCRANLDFISEFTQEQRQSIEKQLTDEQRELENKLNYERYRELVLSLASGATEVDCLDRARFSLRPKEKSVFAL